MILLDHPLIQDLVSLDLPTIDYAVFGSGPLLAAGLVDHISDLDLIGRKSAWNKALTQGPIVTLDSGIQFIRLCEGRIEIYRDWSPGKWDVSLLIDGAKVIEGIRFVTLPQVLFWKRTRNLPKDQEHIRILDTYMRNLVLQPVK